MSDDEKPVTISIAEVQDRMRAMFCIMPPTKYDVSPQEAYITAGSPHGTLRMRSGVHIPDCISCGDACRSYSQAGAREVLMSSMCEPCFDFTAIHPDDCTPSEERWMSLVKYSKEQA